MGSLALLWEKKGKKKTENCDQSWLELQDGNLPNARELFSVVLGLFFHFGFLSKVEVAMAFDTSRLIPSVDDSHMVSSRKLMVVNFSGNLGCDFQSNTTEDCFLKVSESFERRDFDSQTSDITGRRFEGCSKDLNHGCFDSEDDVHFKGDLLSFPKEEVEFSKGFRGELALLKLFSDQRTGFLKILGVLTSVDPGENP